MNYPKHVALIPDGNRTWAKENGFPQISGHLEGLNTVVELTKYIFENTPIEVFTTWGLSTENLKERSKEELDYLFQLYKSFYEKLGVFLKEKNVNFVWAGSEKGLPQELVEFLNQTQLEYNFQSNKYFVMCINYGGQDEILRGIGEYIKSNYDKGVDYMLENLTDQEFGKYLDFASLPNVELVIRTKGNMAQRLSGFMSWTVGYAQLYFSPLKCPEFKTNEFVQALDWFDKCSNYRNYGK